MAFYSKIVEAYDAIFPLNQKQLEFVQEACDGSLTSKNILDIGCGTGSLSIAMARQSAKVRAFDYDPEMVAKANEKRPQALDLQFQQGDMRLVTDYYQPMLFDAALCFGNTLVHLDSTDEVGEMVKSVADRLKPGGKFLLQIVNYDRVLNDQVKSLPTIETEDYTFVRNYIHRPDGKIDFNTILKTETDDAESTHPLLAITQKQLESLLNPYFTQLKFYGAFNRQSWEADTFHCVVEAVK